MNPIRHIRRLAAALAGALLAFAAAAPALARPGPPRSGQLAQPSPHPVPPGWNKHPPLPRGYYAHHLAHQGPLAVPVRAVVIGGMPGWQIALIAAGAALFAATAAVLAYRARAARRKPVTAPA